MGLAISVKSSRANSLFMEGASKVASANITQPGSNRQKDKSCKFGGKCRYAHTLVESGRRRLADSGWCVPMVPVFRDSVSCDDHTEKGDPRSPLCVAKGMLIREAKKSP